MVYETSLAIEDYTLNIVAHDFAIVYLGWEVIQILDRTQARDHMVKISKDMIDQHGHKLRFVVEASGHINFDRNMWTDYKGLYRV